MLNLAKNNISLIEGLRELTRLRVLDLSYNRILRIGHGIYHVKLLHILILESLPLNLCLGISECYNHLYQQGDNVITYNLLMVGEKVYVLTMRIFFLTVFRASIMFVSKGTISRGQQNQ